MWAKKHEKCVKCGTIKKRHVGKGLCVLCYYKIWSLKWYYNHPEECKERVKKYRKLNLEKDKETKKKYYQRNSIKLREYKKEKYYSNSRKYRMETKEYNKKHPEKKKENSFKRYYSDIHYRLKCSVSRAINKKLHFRFSSKKGKSTFSFLPYTVDDLTQYLENLFKPGMNWTNYGEWHIDHKIPDCSFNYKNVEDEEFQKCWALENLQPLWAEENLKKARKLEQ